MVVVDVNTIALLHSDTMYGMIWISWDSTIVTTGTVDIV